MFAHAGTFHVGWFSFDPLVVTALVVAATLYWRAVRVLRARGRRIPWWQQCSFACGLLLVAIATLTVIDSLGASYLLSAHMAQHLLLADLAGPLLLIGVRAPLLYFFWPRPVLVTVARIAPLRRVWTTIRRPRWSLTIWLVTLYAWHHPALYEAALRSAPIHYLEHAMFAFTGMLAWWPLLDPTHNRVVGRIWKAVYVMAARTIGGFLGIVLIVSGAQIYDFYGDNALHFGMSALTDQQLAGAMMMAVDMVVVTLGFFFFIMRIDDTPDQGDTEKPVASAADEPVPGAPELVH